MLRYLSGTIEKGNFSPLERAKAATGRSKGLTPGPTAIHSASDTSNSLWGCGMRQAQHYAGVLSLLHSTNLGRRSPLSTRPLLALDRRLEHLVRGCKSALRRPTSPA